MTIVNDIKPRGTDSAYVNDKPFDEAKAELEKAHYHIPSLEENAQLRIQEGKDAYVSRNGNWVKEDFLYVPGKDKVIFTKNSPIMLHPKEATQAHRDGKEFYVSQEDLDEALTNSIEIPYSQKPIPTNRFGQDEITLFAFGDNAKSYGEFLKDAKINEMPIVSASKDYADKQSQTFARKLWFRGLGGRSGLGGCSGSLHSDYRSRGVRSEVASATEPHENFSGNESEIIKYSQILSNVRNGSLPNSQLEEVIGFLDKLR